MGLAAGSLTERITIQRATTADDGFATSVSAWADYRTVRAERKDVSDRERMASGEYGATLTTRFVVRYSTETATITPRDRIVDRGEVHEIVGVKEIIRRTALEISTVSRPDAQ